MWVMCNLISVCLETVLVSVQDRCTVCAERSTCSEIILDAHTMELLGDVGHIESSFGPFGDTNKLNSR
jgi:hypothetical protein